MGLLLNIDNGGTFTDVCVLGNNQVIHTKTLTTPYDLTKCFVEVLRSAAKEMYGEPNIQRLLAETDYIRYSTTAGTNAIVQKKGPRIGLMIEKGTSVNVLKNRPEEKAMFEEIVDNRIAYIDPLLNDWELESNVVKAVNELLLMGTNRIVVSLSGLSGAIQEAMIKKIILRNYPRHLLGAVPVLFSHELIEDKNDTRRTWSALINSFLHQEMERFLYGAENFLRDYRVKNPLLIYHNNGNSARVAKTTAIQTYGSGPRGGMEGAKAVAEHYFIPQLLTMDIGGTTTDIGVVQEGKIEEKLYGEVEGIPVSFSICDLISIGAGGSSVFRASNGQVLVGPESVGAVPGPACFARGGEEATITDAYLLKGILDPHTYFEGNVKLDEVRSRLAIEQHIATPLGCSLEEALLVMERAYHEKIADGLRFFETDSKNTTLLAFGGAGPMSACAVSRSAGIKRVIIPRLAAVFSAFGIGFSDIAHSYQYELGKMDVDVLHKKRQEILERAKRDMFAEGFNFSECSVYEKVYGRQDDKLHSIAVEDVPNEILAWRNYTELRYQLIVVKPIAHYQYSSADKHEQRLHPAPVRQQKTFQSSIRSWETVPVFSFNQLLPGSNRVGPVLIEDRYFTCYVEENWEFSVNQNYDIVLNSI